MPASPTTKNSSLGGARKTKQDEFYTQLPDIERELKRYRSMPASSLRRNPGGSLKAPSPPA